MIGFTDILGQTGAVEFLQTACLKDRLPHAMIFAGPKGVGKGRCAQALAGWFLCQKPKADHACGECESCRVMPAGNHPDFHIVAKELIRFHDKTGKSKGIDLSINVIRPELVEPASHTAVMGRGKVFVIEQAELMSTAAQNAILKTLEEPSGRTAIILLTDAPESLLPTILSRCQLIRFAALSTALVRECLIQQRIDTATATEAADLSDGSLGGALQLISEGILPISRQLHEQIDQLFDGTPPADLPGWMRKAADAYAEKQMERDPLGSKDAATRAGLGLYLNLASRRFRARLGSTTDRAELERSCQAIDAIARCGMYIDANVTVAVALGQLAAAWTRGFAA